MTRLDAETSKVEERIGPVELRRTSDGHYSIWIVISDFPRRDINRGYGMGYAQAHIRFHELVEEYGDWDMTELDESFVPDAFRLHDRNVMVYRGNKVKRVPTDKETGLPIL